MPCSVGEQVHQKEGKEEEGILKKVRQKPAEQGQNKSWSIVSQTNTIYMSDRGQRQAAVINGLMEGAP